jgi:hypothetical protein
MSEMRKRIFRVIASAAVVFATIQALRVWIFMLAGRGKLPLGAATAFSTFAVFGTGIILVVLGVLGWWVGLKGKATLYVALSALIVTGLSFFVGSLVPGIALFRRSFENKARDPVFLRAVQPWADQKLKSKEGDGEQNIRLRQGTIPDELRTVRGTSQPDVTLVYGMKERRWVFVMAKWREAYSEWGLIFTSENDTQFDGDKDFRRVAPRVYSFYD